MTRRPRVSVVIPAHNRERYIGEAIASILAQTLADFELIVVDDGSIDGTARVVESFGDSRIRLLRNGENLGIPKSRNRGLREARGGYVAWLDSDDLAQPQRLEEQVAFLDRVPEIALVGSWAGTVDASGRWLPRYKVLPIDPEDVQARLLLRCPILQYSMMGRADVLKEYGYCEDFPVAQDFDLFVRLAARHEIANLPRLLVRRRFHSGRVTRERSGLVKTMNQRILARQLEALGVGFREEDLERHFELPRVNKLARRPGLPFLEWAEQWCLSLAAANLAAGNGERPIFEPGALQRGLGRAWFEACLYALPGAPAGVLRHARRSRLRSWARAGSVHYLGRLARRPAPSSRAGHRLARREP